MSETGDVLYSQQKEITSDSTGNVSYSFGEENIDQVVLDDLKSKNQKYHIKVQLVPAEEPVKEKFTLKRSLKRK